MNYNTTVARTNNGGSAVGSFAAGVMMEERRRKVDLLYRLMTAIDGVELQAHVRGLGQLYLRKYGRYILNANAGQLRAAYEGVFGELDDPSPHKGILARNTSECRRCCLFMVFVSLVWDATYREKFVPTPSRAGASARGVVAVVRDPSVDVTAFHLWYQHHLTPAIDRFMDGVGTMTSITKIVDDLVFRYTIHLPADPQLRVGRSMPSHELDASVLSGMRAHAAEHERRAAEYDALVQEIAKPLPPPPLAAATTTTENVPTPPRRTTTSVTTLDMLSMLD
jgi:hypothetical protein